MLCYLDTLILFKTIKINNKNLLRRSTPWYILFIWELSKLMTKNKAATVHVQIHHEKSVNAADHT